MSTAQLALRLEFAGRTIRSGTTGDLPKVFEIGRGDAAFWRVPRDDKRASKIHARITSTGKKVFIEDADSRNGVWLTGEKITRRAMKPGDVYGIGDCKLVVEEHRAAAAVKANPWHRLEYLTGTDKGKLVNLEKPKIVIGSGSECDIRLNDNYAIVSHAHAELENQLDGTCWIRDLGSRNGTKINGFVMSAEVSKTGRMLKDGDIITIGYMDFRFWNRNVLHVRSNILMKSIAVVLTLAITLGGYFAVQTIFPSAKSLRLAAERRAAEADFAGARTLLEASSNARGAEEDHVSREALRKQIEIWEQTAATWRKLRDDLRARNEPDAPKRSLAAINKDLVGIVSCDAASWRWNTTSAPEQRAAAAAAHVYISAYLDVFARVSSGRNTPDQLGAELEKLNRAEETCRRMNLDFLAELNTRSERNVRSVIRELTAEWKEIEAVMAAFGSIDGAGAALEGLRKVRERHGQYLEKRRADGLPNSYVVLKRAEELLAPVTELEKTGTALTRNETAAAEFRFADFKPDIPLPTAEACAVYPTLAERRTEAIDRNGQFGKIARQLKLFRENFARMGIADGKTPAAVEAVCDRERLQKVLDCDCFAHPPPKYTSKEATSVYDEYAGVYVLNEYLANLDTSFDTQILSERFTPQVFKAKEIFSSVDMFLDYCANGGGVPATKAAFERVVAVNNGANALVGLRSAAQALSATRDRLVRQLFRTWAGDKETRAGIIAGTLAQILRTPGMGYIPKDFAAQLMDGRKALRRKIDAVLKAKATDDPAAVLEKERAALKIAIPGDRSVRLAWEHSGGVK